jgi:menaquinone-9 beta-reductase
MMKNPPKRDYDVIIVGASAAGCATAILYAQHGLSVALLEQRAGDDFHKPVCTHYLQSCAIETLKRMGADRAIEAAGGVRTVIRIWTRWGWINGATPATGYGYNIRRVTLDPILRGLARSLENITFLPGHRLAQILDISATDVHVNVVRRGDSPRKLSAQLLVGADGRDSNVASAAGVAEQRWVNNRFSCFATFKNVENDAGGRSKMWLLDPEVAYQFPNDASTTLVALMPTRDKLAAFREDRQGSFEKFIGRLSEPPILDPAERLTPLIINTDNANILRGRPPARVALVGDAMMSSDPLHGLGIAWSCMSAAWLVDSSAEALRGGKDLRAPLARYFKTHRHETRGHLGIITDMSRAAKFSAVQRLLFAAAARDRAVAEVVNDFLAGDIPVSKFLAPSVLLRSALVNLRHGSSSSSAPIERPALQVESPKHP